MNLTNSTLQEENEEIQQLYTSLQEKYATLRKTMRANEARAGYGGAARRIYATAVEVLDRERIPSYKGRSKWLR